MVHDDVEHKGEKNELAPDQTQIEDAEVVDVDCDGEPAVATSSDASSKADKEVTTPTLEQSPEENEVVTLEIDTSSTASSKAVGEAIKPNIETSSAASSKAASQATRPNIEKAPKENAVIKPNIEVAPEENEEITPNMEKVQAKAKAKAVSHKKAGKQTPASVKASPT